MNRGLQRVYAQIAPKYELVNHLLTLGLDIRWRRAAARQAAQAGGLRWLDVCCGTGEMALDLKRRAGAEVRIFGADFSLPMLERARAKPAASEISFVCTQADALPFADESFDLLTIAFAARNLNTTRDALVSCFRELARVLKPGGWFVNVETSQPPSRLIRTLYKTYVGLFVQQLGKLVSGHEPGYGYLASSIAGFYDADELASLLRQAGFAEVTYRRMLFGAVAVHKSVKTPGESAWV